MEKILESTFPKNLQVATSVGGHVLLADQSPYAGGNGEGPAPFGFFLASISSCAAFYALAFCIRRGIDTTGMKVELYGDFNAATHLYNAFEVKLITPEGFPEKYEKAIVRSMEQCAVANHLEAGSKVIASTDLAEKAGK